MTWIDCKRIYSVGCLPTFAPELAEMREAAGYELLDYERPEPFLAGLGKHRPGCVVLPPSWPYGDGFSVLAELAFQRADLAAVMVAEKADPAEAVRASGLGASAYLSRPITNEQFRGVIEAALARPRGLAFAEVLQRRVELIRSISPREMEVLELLLGGNANKAIGFRLQISERTVEVHRARMMRRLGVGSFAELIRLAILAGIKAVP